MRQQGGSRIATLNPAELAEYGGFRHGYVSRSRTHSRELITKFPSYESRRLPPARRPTRTTAAHRTRSNRRPTRVETKPHAVAAREPANAVPPVRGQSALRNVRKCHNAITTAACPPWRPIPTKRSSR